jgi:hypothetical protein
MPHLRRGVGQGGSFGNFTNNAAFLASWGPVGAQLQAEGNAPGSFAYQLAQNDFANAVGQLAQAPEAQGADILNAAQQYTIAGHTIQGAFSTVTQLIQAANNGVSAPQAVQLFTGTMIGVAVLAGAVSAGAGAAIVGAIGIISDLLLGGGSPGFSIPGCPGTTFSQAPNYSVGCVAVFGLDPVTAGPGTANWKSFPSVNNPNDAHWFDSSLYGWSGIPGYGQWSGGIPGFGYRLIDVAFPAYNTISCSLQTPAGTFAGDFLRHFFSAWKANQEYALNGLKAQPDWQVLAHAIRLWNMAHAPGTPFLMAPSPLALAVDPACSDFTVGYEHMLVTDVVNNIKGDSLVPIQNGNLVVNTGPLIPPPQASNVTLPGAPAKSTVGATAVKVAAGTGVAVLGGIGLVALAKGWAFGKTVEWAWGKTGGKVVGAVKREMRKLHR